MPQYSYQSARGLPIKKTAFCGTAQEFAKALAEDCRGDYGVEPDVRVWDRPGDRAAGRDSPISPGAAECCQARRPPRVHPSRSRDRNAIMALPSMPTRYPEPSPDGLVYDPARGGYYPPAPQPEPEPAEDAE